VFMLRTPLNELFYAVVPGLGSLKPLARASFLLCFVVAALSAFGLDRASQFVTARRPGRNAVLAVVLVACACIGIVVWQAKGLAREDLHTQDPTPAAVFPSTPLTDTLASLDEPRILPLYRMLRASTPMVQQIDSAIGYESLLPNRVARFWQVVSGVAPGYADASKLDSAYFPQYAATGVRYDLLARAGVSYVAAIPGTTLPKAGTPGLHGIAPPTLAYNGTDGLLYKLAGATGLTTVLSSCTAVSSERAALGTFADNRFPASTKLLLEQPVSTLVGYCGGASTKGDRSSIATNGIDSYVAHATLHHAGMLLVRINSYPGWHATVDGKPAKLVRADYLFQALALGAGTHRITLTFAPRSVRDGELISLATLVIVLGVLGFDLVRRRRTPAAV
jgi:hypothetical protein